MSGNALMGETASSRIGWMPGQSGNPAGRPKRVDDISRLCRRLGIRAVDVLDELLGDSDPRVRFAAAKELLDRGYGKPMQALTTPDAATTITFLHLVAARAFSEQMQAGNVPVIEGNTDVDTGTVSDATKSAPNLMEPAKE